MTLTTYRRHRKVRWDLVTLAIAALTVIMLLCWWQFGCAARPRPTYAMSLELTSKDLHTEVGVSAPGEPKP